MKKIKLLFALFLTSLLTVNCSSSKDDELPSDPLVGNWSVRAIYTTETQQAVEVTNIQCLKDWTISVSSNTLSLFLSVPNEQTNQCNTTNQELQWENSNGTYYLINNGQRVEAPIQFNDNYQTLQVNFQEEGFIAIYRKI